MNWYENEIGVPFGNANYDVTLGGSHDMTFLCPPNTPITQIAAKGSKITDISSPSWGKQVTVELPEPVNGHDYFAILHLAAVNPWLAIGDIMNPGDIVGWSGGCTQLNQYDGTHNPTGMNFLNTPDMSSQPQVGIALCDGPSYGGIGWKKFPPIDGTLNPQSVLDAYLKSIATPAPDYKRMQFEIEFRLLSPNLPIDGLAIAEAAYQDYLKGKDRGPALGPETAWKDWNGKEQRVQAYLMGMYYWNAQDGVTWHPYSSRT